MTLTTDDRRRAQVKPGARRARDRYADLFDFAPIGLLTLDEKGVISRVNLTGGALLGFDPVMLRGSRFARFVQEEDVDRWGRFLSDLVRGGDTESCDLAIWRSDGSPFAGHVDGRFRAFFGPESSVLVALTDVSERKRSDEAHERAMAALAASEEHFRRLVQCLPIPTALANPSREIVYLNDQFTRVLGYSRDDIPTLGAWHRRANPDETHRRWAGETWTEGVQEAARSGRSAPPTACRVRCKNGDVRTMLLSAVPLGDSLLLALVDVSEERARQAQLALASRLAALGTLVTGVAHEIDNPLAAELADHGLAVEVILEVRDRLRGDTPLDRQAEARALDGVVEVLDDAMESGERMARVVKDLATFGRSDSKRSRLPLFDVVERALRWMPAAVARTASIRLEDGGAPDVIASPGQIEQVVVHLVTNAVMATPEGRRDTVIVRVGPGEEGMARLEVIDHGVGIDPAIRERILEPFFTTRKGGAGKGMGLGLSICQAVVMAHGGTITMTSEVGKGSSFRVELPDADEGAGRSWRPTPGAGSAGRRDG